MSLDWDKNKGSRDKWITWLCEIMAECNRVLKPGAHILVWALPRTSGWTQRAIEDAGFYVKDIITHVNGEGMGKGLNIAKAIDKALGEKGIVVGKGYHCNKRDVYGAYHDEYDIIAPSSEIAKQWEGWNTQLKPGSEHWILAQKPPSESNIALNVIKWNVGGINIDACRVPPASGEKTSEEQPEKIPNYKNKVYGKGLGGCDWSLDTNGRFPTNMLFSHTENCTDVCVEECPVYQLNQQGGYSKSKRSQRGKVQIFKGSGWQGESTERGFNDEGGVSRFFTTFHYFKKTNKKEKGEFNTHPTSKSLSLSEWLIKLITPENGIVLDPFMGSGSIGLAAKNLNLGYCGIELSKEYFEIAERRLHGT